MFFYNLDNAIEKLVPPNGTVLQIGANNGDLMDPINKWVNQLELEGVLVEPLPHLAKELRHTYPDKCKLAIEEVAITLEDSPDSIMMCRDPKFFNKNLHHYHQIGQLETSPNISDTSLAKLQDVEDEHVIKIKVEGVAMPTLLDKYPEKLKKVDLFQMDVEGFDCSLIQQIPFSRIKPTVIHYEFLHSPKEEQLKAIKCLCDQDYLPFTPNGLDILAVEKKNLNKLMDPGTQKAIQKYQHYLDEGKIKNDDGKGQENLICAVILLHQAANCSTSSVATDVMDFADNIRSTGARRPPNWLMFKDALDRMKPLFADTAAFADFLENEMPDVELASKLQENKRTR